MSKFETPLYSFEDKDGKEICKNFCLIEQRTLKDGRTILVAILSETVDLDKDPVLKEYFDSMR